MAVYRLAMSLMSKKNRNRFLAIACLLVFVGLGFLYYVNWVVHKPFAVILILADNFNVSTLTAARMYGGGADSRLAIERFPHMGVLTSHAADFAVADPASAGTAIATGRKANNRSLGHANAPEPSTNLAQIARDQGRAVGLVTNASVADAGAAAFYATTSQPHDSSAIASSLVTSPGFNVLLGGGANDFIPEHKGGRRSDGRDLTLELRQAGYDLIRTRLELENTPAWRQSRTIGLFADGNLAFADEIARAGSQPTLAQMVGQAIQLLQFNRKGYFLVVDAGLVGKAAAQNEGERMLREFLQLDAAVSTALAYAGENSLIVVAGRSAIGGMRINGFPFRSDKGVAIVGINAQGVPSITWSSGPGSRFPEGTSESPPSEPSAFAAPAALPVAEDALAVAVGPGAEMLSGFQDNTDLFRLISGNL